jgi:hypothetical protein
VSKVGAACQFRGVYAASILFPFAGVVPHVLARAQLFTGVHVYIGTYPQRVLALALPNSHGLGNP